MRWWRVHRAKEMVRDGGLYTELRMVICKIKMNYSRNNAQLLVQFSDVKIFNGINILNST